MKRWLKQIVRRLPRASRWIVLSPAASDALQGTVAEIGGDVSQVQQQVGDTLSHVIALRREIAEARGLLPETLCRVSETQFDRQGELAYHPPPRLTEWLVENRMLVEWR
jgi:hypothetical protein